MLGSLVKIRKKKISIDIYILIRVGTVTQLEVQMGKNFPECDLGNFLKCCVESFSLFQNK